ncbi:MAG: hypothetical protein GXO42_00775 [bacterium]|nr:hypothetical protein [bacterium]
MISALKELALLSRYPLVTVIYSGGDDLLLACPRGVLLDVIELSKRCFSGMLDEEVPGFIRLGKNYTPALTFIGRTYAVVLAHPYFPMKFVLEEARRIQHNKDKITYCGEKKNALAMLRITRSYNKELAAVPFARTLNPRKTSHDEVREQLEYIISSLEKSTPKALPRRKIGRLFRSDIYAKTLQELVKYYSEQGCSKYKQALGKLLEQHFVGENEELVKQTIQQLLSNSLALLLVRVIGRESTVLLELLRMAALLQAVRYYEAREVARCWK